MPAATPGITRFFKPVPVEEKKKDETNDKNTETVQEKVQVQPKGMRKEPRYTLDPIYNDYISKKIESITGGCDDLVKFKVLMSVIYTGDYSIKEASETDSSVPSDVLGEEIVITEIADCYSCNVYKFSSSSLVNKELVVKIYKDVYDGDRIIGTDKRYFLRDHKNISSFRKYISDPDTPECIKKNMYVYEKDVTFFLVEAVWSPYLKNAVKIYGRVGIYHGVNFFQAFKSIDHSRISIDRVVKNWMSFINAIAIMNKIFYFHCNITPSNILFDINTNSFKLIDFDNGYPATFLKDILSKESKRQDEEIEKGKMKPEDKYVPERIVIETVDVEASYVVRGVEGIKKGTKVFVDPVYEHLKAIFQTTELDIYFYDKSKRISTYKDGRFVIDDKKSISFTMLMKTERFSFMYIMLHFICMVVSQKELTQWSSFIVNCFYHLLDMEWMCKETSMRSLVPSRLHWFYKLNQLIKYDDNVKASIENYCKTKPNKQYKCLKNFFSSLVDDFNPNDKTKNPLEIEKSLTLTKCVCDCTNPTCKFLKPPQQSTDAEYKNPNKKMKC
eukprot:14460-Hanusia_phi.AAC.4